MDAFIKLVVQHRFLVIFVVLLVATLGVHAARTLPVDAVPDLTNQQVQILTNAPALGPVEVEQYITTPIELAMGGLQGVESIRSLSRFGLSAVTLVFEEGTDIYFARQQVAERLPQAGAAIGEEYGSPELGPLTSGLGEIYQFEVRAENTCDEDAPDDDSCYSLMELRTILDWYVSPGLRPVPGVVEVNAFGGELRTYEVAVDPLRLSAQGLALHDIFDAIESNNADAGGGYILSGAGQRVIRGEGRLQSLDDLRAVRVATRTGGVPIYIDDIAEVRFAPMLRHGAVTRDGRGEVVTGSVMMRTGENARVVAREVGARLDVLAQGLPPGVTVETWYDRSELVESTVRTVATNLIEGGVLVIVVLLLLLGNVRGGLLVAAVIPLSLLMTFIVMAALGQSGNLMSLGALDFGLIIDGAIVVTENIARRLAEARSTGKSVAAVVRSATAEVMRPVLSGTAIIMIVYVPILTLEGIEGRMFRPMAIAVLAALTAALFLALTLVPAVATWIFAGGVREKEPLVSRWTRALYQPCLRLAMRFRAITVGAAIILVAAGGWLTSAMGTDFMPTLDEGAIAIQAVRLPSVSLEESIAATGRLEASLLDAYPDEIRTIVSRTGRAEIATDPMGVEISDIFVMLHPTDSWTRATDAAELVEGFERVLANEVPGQNYSFSQPIELRTNELISGSRADIAINVFGPDLQRLNEVANNVMGVLSTVDGASDLSADQVAGLPTLTFSIDRPALARYGVDVADVLDTIAAVGGRQTGVVMHDQQRIALQVRLQEHARRNAQAIGNLLIHSDDGQGVRLASLARITEGDGPAVVNREQAQRRTTIQVNVRGRDLAGFVNEAQERIADADLLPPGYFATWSGQFENLQSAARRLYLVVPLALASIFLILYTTFGSARPALIIFFNIPIAAVGGITALWLRDLPLSISAAVGFIALAGIAVLNGVVMVSAIRDLQREGLGLHEATARGAEQRLRPVLMTALTDGIGFLPMALSTSAGAEVQQPLATVVVGGLVTATVLTLFVLPALYSFAGGEVE
jgi:cobalt-zinc-cadmium resistance protein CzcA